MIAHQPLFTMYYFNIQKHIFSNSKLLPPTILTNLKYWFQIKNKMD